jgi:hypothetical protein
MLSFSFVPSCFVFVNLPIVDERLQHRLRNRFKGLLLPAELKAKEATIETVLYGLSA